MSLHSDSDRDTRARTGAGADARTPTRTRTSVVKFGGSSFASPEHYRRVAAHLAARVAAGERIVAVVSGMPGATEQLRGLALGIDERPSVAALHGVLPLADTIGAGLLRVALEQRGVATELLHGQHTGLRSDGTRDRAARLTGFDPAPFEAAWRRASVVVMPGGQASDGGGSPAWLGKNSSDLSATALAAGLGLDTCEIYSDVDGVYDADPRLVPDARRIAALSYDDVVLLARHGAKVLHPEAVRAAERGGVRIVCRLNSGDFAAGSVIDATGSGRGVDAVLLDARSVVVAFGTAGEADAAHTAVEAAGAPAHRPAAAESDGRHLLAVSGGFFDVRRCLDEAGLGGEITGERLLAAVTGSRTALYVAADQDAALALGRDLHRDVCGALQAA
ncbi:aspartate kinase [Streptomyces sp. NPDC090025]|uniref:amino acid kinase family protein n=1 Tax=Streptomyces sp. NPDC090025 TaxID=3365922 RepID=UPI00383756B6